jgi:hypothetical protein
MVPTDVFDARLAAQANECAAFMEFQRIGFGAQLLTSSAPDKFARTGRGRYAADVNETIRQARSA